MLPGHSGKSPKKVDFFFENLDLGENSLTPRKGELQRGIPPFTRKVRKSRFPGREIAFVTGKQCKTVRFHVYMA